MRSKADCALNDSVLKGRPTTAVRQVNDSRRYTDPILVFWFFKFSYSMLPSDLSRSLTKAAALFFIYALLMACACAGLDKFFSLWPGQ